MTVRVDDRLHKDFKLICVQLGVGMTEQVQALMLGFIARNADKLPAREK